MKELRDNIVQTHFPTASQSIFIGPLELPKKHEFQQTDSVRTWARSVTVSIKNSWR